MDRRCYGDGGITAGVCWPRSASLLSASPRDGPAIWARSRVPLWIMYRASLRLVRSLCLGRENTGHFIPPVINCRSWSMVLGASTRTRPYRPATWAVMNGGASVRGPPHRLAGVCWLRSEPSLSASPRGGAVMRGGASICGPPHRLAGYVGRGARRSFPRPLGVARRSDRGLGWLFGECTWRRGGWYVLVRP